MAGFLYNMLLMSVSGTMMFLLATLLYKQTKSKYARWYYALIITSVLLFVLPLHGIFAIPKAFTVEVPTSMAVYADGGTAAGELGIDISYIIFGIWAAGALSLIAFNVYSYIRTRRTLMNISRITLDARVLCACREAEKTLGIRKSIGVRKSDMLRSPLLFGVLKPTVILPDADFSDGELRMIFTHELTHYRHRDILVKLAAILASSLHWFNPCVYFMRNAVNNGCELCCDETVLSVLDLKDKKQYGRLLLSIIEGSKGGFAYTTAMSSQQSIKHRLLKIVEFKRMSLPVKMVSVMTTLSMIICSVTAFGFDVVKDTLPESISKAIGGAGRSYVDASGAYMTEEAVSEPPTQQETSVASETEKPREAIGETDGEAYDAQENVTESYTVIEYIPVSEGETAVYEQPAAAEPAITPARDYTPVYTEPSYEDTYAVLPENAQEMGEDDYSVDKAVDYVSFPDTSYMFNPSFSGTAGEKVKSSLIKVTRDSYMYINNMASADFRYGLYSADGALLLTDRQILNSKIPVKAGSEYYIIAESDTKYNAHIYIYSK